MMCILDFFMITLPLLYLFDIIRGICNTQRIEYQEIISKVTYFRRLMLICKMPHHKDPIKDVNTNLGRRPLELTGPLICLFSMPSLTTTATSKDFAARDEILPVLSSFKTKR